MLHENKVRIIPMKHSGIMLPLFLIALVSLLVTFATALWAASPGTARFFIMGDGKIHIKNAKTGQEINADLFNADGSLNEAGFDQIDAVFGFPTGEKGEHISPRLICMLDYFSDLAAPGKVINLDSGYRSPQYNTTLRDAGGNVARTSQHIDGMAIDFNIQGVEGKKLWELIRGYDCCGVGYYGGNAIHLDSARPRFWEAATSKVRGGESDYNQRIYLSTDYDRYRPGERARLALSSISDFSFGVKPTVAITGDTSADGATARISSDAATECIRITTRKASRFLSIQLPASLQPGRYRIKVDFCERPFPQMPVETLSNVIEIID